MIRKEVTLTYFKQETLNIFFQFKANGLANKACVIYFTDKVQLDATEGIDVYNIEEKYIHPKYNEATEPQHLYDIALVRLSESVHSKAEVLPVCLWNDDIQSKINVMPIHDFDFYYLVI